MKKRFTLKLLEHSLKNVSVTTRDASNTSNTSNTEIAQNYQNIYGYSKTPLYHYFFNGLLLKKVLVKTKLDFCKLCLSKKFLITRSP